MVEKIPPMVISGDINKYILRNGRKSEREKTIEDLKKAIFYLNDKIEMLENETKN